MALSHNHGYFLMQDQNSATGHLVKGDHGVCPASLLHFVSSPSTGLEFGVDLHLGVIL